MNAIVPLIPDLDKWQPVAVRGLDGPWTWLMPSRDVETLQAARQTGKLAMAQRREGNGFTLVVKRGKLMALGLNVTEMPPAVPLEIPARPLPWAVPAKRSDPPMGIPPVAAPESPAAVTIHGKTKKPPGTRRPNAGAADRRELPCVIAKARSQISVIAYQCRDGNQPSRLSHRLLRIAAMLARAGRPVVVPDRRAPIAE